jgi:glucosamine-6-phosphate deaminase
MNVPTSALLTSGVHVWPTGADAGADAARTAAAAILEALDARGGARVIFASAPSQEQMIAALSADPRIDWSRVTSFHMDEYLGLDPDRPQAFGRWLADRLPAAALPGFARIDSAADPTAEAARYAALLSEAPIDVTCLGFGMNGHVAFNEPGVARFDDPELLRVVELDARSRHQQVEEGLFPTLDDVPTRALTLTVPALMSAAVVVATVPGAHKARAVADALAGPVSPDCPASVLRTHPRASIHLDAAAAALVPEHVGSAAPQDAAL